MGGTYQLSSSDGLISQSPGIDWNRETKILQDKRKKHNYHVIQETTEQMKNMLNCFIQDKNNNIGVNRISVKHYY